MGFHCHACEGELVIYLTVADGVVGARKGEDATCTCHCTDEELLSILEDAYQHETDGYPLYV